MKFFKNYFSEKFSIKNDLESKEFSEKIIIYKYFHINAIYGYSVFNIHKHLILDESELINRKIFRQ